jgi:Tfp pilus assembly protein PilO
MDTRIQPAVIEATGAQRGLLGRVGALAPRVLARARTAIDALRDGRYVERVGVIPRIGRLSGIGLVLLMASIVLWFSTLAPLRQNVAELRDEVRHLEAAAARPGGSAPPSLAGQANAFIRQLPTRSALPTVLATVVSQATAAGLQLERGDYEFTHARSGLISRYRVTLPVRGTYGQVRSFVDNTLASLPAVALESLKLERDDIGDEELQADLQFAVMVRSDL